MPPRRARVNQSQGAQPETGGVQDFGSPRLTLCSNLGVTKGRVDWAMLSTAFDIRVLIHG
ncbi:hypothetical protein [Nostoc sp. LEGE 12450]|uniref:hypothetical protein n=1 Tax=Nostoc sp. LEGE 12450 TaxID=1828643 RepID=UPI0018813CA6|nr:hypothetical protein [Nostoc sp. LEGE 12450]MBE8990352.1 hypothetical protein [Nostoc sp. LEGE 12450]